MKQLYSVLSFAVIALLPITIHTKRHSRNSKVERYEKRALEAAKSNSPLAKALSKQTKSMSFDEALLAQEYYRSVNENDMVIKCGERLLAVGGEQDALRLTRLELADLFLKKQIS